MEEDMSDESNTLISQGDTWRNYGETGVICRGPAESLEWRFLSLARIVVISVIVYTGCFTTLEMYHLTMVRNTTECIHARNVTNTMLTIYLLLCFVGVVVQLLYVMRNNNWLEETRFDNYPMLVVMILWGCVDIAFYIVQFLKYTTEIHVLEQVFATASELLFCVGILPLVIICVCYKVRDEHPGMRKGLSVTMCACIGGCVMIFLKRISWKIARDIGISCIVCRKEYEYIHATAENVERLLNLVDITYVLIGLVFLADLLMKMSFGQVQSIHEADASVRVVTRDFLTTITMVRYRWPVVLLSTMLAIVYLTASYFINRISYSNMSPQFKDKCTISFNIITLAVYVSCIFFSSVYFFTDHRSTPISNQEHPRNDSSFGKFTSSVQIFYVCSLFGFFVWTYWKTPMPPMFQMKMVVLVFLILQVFTQLWYINSSIIRRATYSSRTYWSSRLFPPLPMALFNFAFFVYSIGYHDTSSWSHTWHPSHENVFRVLRDAVAPVAMLNRLHGMAFFINLSIQQWHDS